MNAWEIKREARIPICQERIKACRTSGIPVKAWRKENGFTKQKYYEAQREAERSSHLCCQPEGILCTFLYHGKIEASNNQVENAQRRVVVGT